MGVKNRFSIPPSAGEVAAKMLNPKFKSNQPSVEEAKAAMIAAAEPATTVKGGTRVPKFVAEANRGVGGNVALEEVQAAPITVHAAQNEVVPATPARNTEEQERRSRVALRFNAQQKLQRAGFRNGQSVDLIIAVKDGIVTKEEAEALLGRNIVVETPATETEEERLVVEPPVEVVPVLSDAVKTVEEAESERERYDEGKFILELYKEGKNWVAELVYKNGAGTEKFIAPTQKELLVKISRGKGYSTLKIRSDRERFKLGNEFQTWDFFLASILEEQGVSAEEFSALPEKSRNIVYDNYQTVHIQNFLRDYPEYYPTPENWARFVKLLDKKSAPISLHNLELVYKELSDDELLDVRPVTKVETPAPVAEVTPVKATVTATKVEDSTPAAPAPAAAASQPMPRKRGSTGLIPGQSSAAPEPLKATEEGNPPRELSEAELRRLPMADLKRIATKDRKYGIIR